MTPPRYLFHDGHWYVLSTHAGAQMQRAMLRAQLDFILAKDAPNATPEPVLRSEEIIPT